MRAITTILFLSIFFSKDCLAQKGQGIFDFDHIPSIGDTTVSGWKFHPGDDSAWANPAFDDSNWPTEDGGYFGAFKNKYKDPIGWFRLKINVAPAFRNTIKGFSIVTQGAFEIYLNGKMIKKNGIIDLENNRVVVWTEEMKVFPVLLTGDSIQVLAVRFAYRKNALLVPEFRRRWTMAINIGSPDLLYGNFKGNAPFWMAFLVCFFSGLNFILFILHGAMYLYYRRGRQNLSYAFYALFMSVGWLYPLFLALFLHNQETKILHQAIYNTVLIYSAAFYVITIYRFFNYRKRIVLRSLLLLSTLIFFGQFFAPEPVALVLINLVSVLYILEASRVTIAAFKRKLKGATIVFSGIIMFFVFFLTAGIALVNEHLDLSTICLALGTASILIMMSIAIARQVAQTSVELEQQLKENLNLSEEKQRILSEQNIVLEENVTKRTLELSDSLRNLKDAQAQLIQSEKMASLGELTAGIAHEIQNPLNFVNNFSEVSGELVDEMNEELEKGDIDEAKAIALNLRQNLEKIRNHGKRADGIVKGMLEHSRSSSGVKELTDINTLTEEYFRLAYHGARAKSNTFNVTMKTDFDAYIGRVNIIAQDIGRVILNLVNNAFYAVSDKQEPTVWVTTKMLDDKVFISVRDNGPGIPAKILDKIFQPFFTTKPTGQGTGLGLSLCYDIVKAHGGKLKVITEEGSGSEFIIQLPVG